MHREVKRNLRRYGTAALVAVLALGAMVTGCQTTTTTTAEQPATEQKCSDCHNETTLVFAKRLQWDESLHGSGESYLRGTSASCAGCHSSEGYVKRIATNIAPNKVTEGDTNPTPPNCRTCHQIHATYTEADFALRTTAPVSLYVSGKTFDAGEGNLCATCHQPRTAAPKLGGGSVNITSTHWGPHYGVQSTMLLGTGGYGPEGSPSIHYTVVKDSCTTCHMVNGRHEMEANVTACQTCHAGLNNFDYKGVQTEVKALFEELGELLEAKGLLHDGHPVVGVYPEQQAGALWIYRVIEPDGSFGVHNPAYTKALLQSAIDALK